MRASGYPKKAMFTMMIGAVLNVILDPIFIFWLDMGIQGAAIATVISMAAGAAFVMSHFISKDSIVRFHTKYFRLKGSIIWNIFTIGMSPFFHAAGGQCGCGDHEPCVEREWRRFGDWSQRYYFQYRHAAGYVDYRYRQGMQPIVGFNHGAGHHDRVLATFAVVYYSIDLDYRGRCIVSLLFPRLIVSVFSTDAELVSITDNGLRPTMLVFFRCRFPDYDQPVFSKYRCRMESDVSESKLGVLFLIPAIPAISSDLGIDGVCKRNLSPISSRR